MLSSPDPGSWATRHGSHGGPRGLGFFGGSSDAVASKALSSRGLRDGQGDEGEERGSFRKAA